MCQRRRGLENCTRSAHKPGLKVTALSVPRGTSNHWLCVFLADFFVWRSGLCFFQSKVLGIVWVRRASSKQCGTRKIMCGQCPFYNQHVCLLLKSWDQLRWISLLKHLYFHTLTRLASRLAPTWNQRNKKKALNRICECNNTCSRQLWCNTSAERVYFVICFATQRMYKLFVLITLQLHLTCLALMLWRVDTTMVS